MEYLISLPLRQLDNKIKIIKKIILFKTKQATFAWGKAPASSRATRGLGRRREGKRPSAHPPGPAGCLHCQIEREKAGGSLKNTSMPFVLLRCSCPCPCVVASSRLGATMSFVGGLSWAEKHDTDVILRLRQSALLPCMACIFFQVEIASKTADMYVYRTTRLISRSSLAFGFLAAWHFSSTNRGVYTNSHSQPRFSQLVDKEAALFRICSLPFTSTYSPGPRTITVPAIRSRGVRRL